MAKTTLITLCRGRIEPGTSNNNRKGKRMNANAKIHRQVMPGAIVLAVVSMLVCAALPVQAASTSIISSDFSFGFGATDSARANSAWSTIETSSVNTATTLGDFSFSVALPTSNRFSGSGLQFINRVITDGDPAAATTAGQTGADPSYGFPNGLTVPITASYNGAAPADSTPGTFKMMVEITSLSVYGGWHSASSTPATMAWEDVTSGHPQTSSAVALPFPPGATSGGDAKTLANYAQLDWDPDDFETPLASLNDSFTRTFGIVGRLASGDLRLADGIEVEGRVHLIYDKAVPEPASVALLSLGGLMMIRRQRRRA